MQNGVNTECWLLAVYVMVFSARWCRAILMRAYFLYVEGVGGGISKGRGNILLEPDLVCNYALIKMDVLFILQTFYLSLLFTLLHLAVSR